MIKRKMDKFKCESIRLCRFLYGLGFNKQSVIENGIEYWLFDKSNDLQESLDFYFYMRKKIRKSGANEKWNLHV